MISVRILVIRRQVYLSLKDQKSAFTFNFVTPRNMTRIIGRLKNTRAIAMDEIETEVWKKGVTVLAGPITRMCNLSMSTGVFNAA